MPLYLRRDAIRRLEASLNALHMALSQLGSTDRHEVREENSKYAAEVGLIGSAAELAMSACLVHAHGPSVQKWPSGNYKAFPQILKDFKSLVNDARPSSKFLVEGVDDAKDHREELIDACSRFRVLSSVRAGGLHAGRGPIREAAVVQGNGVSNFIEVLAKSSKMRPYLKNVPRCPFFDKERTVIVEDLARRLNEASGADKEALLASVFLVLPEIPEEKPEWIEALDRVSIAPTDNDIDYLLDIVDDAVPATLRRTTRSGTAVSVRVDQQDPDALPIATQYLRRQFNERRDQIYADVGTANGRLEDEILDLPPAEAVREMFAIGLKGAGLSEGDSVTPHESWPFVAASLSVPGTIGPYWFLVRETEDLGQLAAQLRRAVDAGGKRLGDRSKECLDGIAAIRDDNEVPAESGYFQGVAEDLQSAEESKSSLNENCERHKETAKGLKVVREQRLQDIIDGSPAGPLIESILEDPKSQESLQYWVRVLCEAALDVDDLPSLVKVLDNGDLSAAHTAARKAMRRIDFRLNGPSIES